MNASLDNLISSCSMNTSVRILKLHETQQLLILERALVDILLLISVPGSVTRRIFMGISSFDVLPSNVSIFRSIGGLQVLEIRSCPDLVLRKHYVLRELRTLILDEDSIKKVPKIINTWSTLQILSLQRNVIKSVDVEFSLPNVEKIFLSGNQISFISPKAFLACPNLKYLFLNNNRLSGLGSYCCATALRHLDVSNNEIAVISKDFSPGCISLRSIALENNTLGAGVIEHVLVSLKLTKRSIGYTNSDESQEAEFGGIFFNNCYPLMNDSGPGIGSELALPNESERLYFKVKLDNSSFFSMESVPVSSCEYRPSNHVELCCSLPPANITSFIEIVDYLIENRDTVKFVEVPQMQFISKDFTNNMGSVNDLTIYKCNISEIPDAFDPLRILKTLDLSVNMLTEIPISLFNLKSLERLGLRENRITRLPSNSTCMKSLKMIELGNNRITDISENAFCESSPIEVLDLDSNLLEIYPYSIRRLSKLKILAARYNQIARLDFSICSKSLTLLDLQNNSISYVAEHVFDECFSLKKITLSYNKLHYLGPNLCPPYVVALDLNYNNLSYISENFRCDNLNDLFLVGNQILSVPINTFRNTSLNVLDIRYNSLTDDFPREALAENLPRNLSLEGNNWACVCSLDWISSYCRDHNITELLCKLDNDSEIPFFNASLCPDYTTYNTSSTTELEFTSPLTTTESSRPTQVNPDRNETWGNITTVSVDTSFPAKVTETSPIITSSLPFPNETYTTKESISTSSTPNATPENSTEFKGCEILTRYRNGVDLELVPVFANVSSLDYMLYWSPEVVSQYLSNVTVKFRELSDSEFNESAVPAHIGNYTLRNFDRTRGYLACLDLGPYDIIGINCVLHAPQPETLKSNFDLSNVTYIVLLCFIASIAIGVVVTFKLVQRSKPLIHWYRLISGYHNSSEVEPRRRSSVEASYISSPEDLPSFTFPVTFSNATFPGRISLTRIPRCKLERRKERLETQPSSTSSTFFDISRSATFPGRGSSILHLPKCSLVSLTIKKPRTPSYLSLVSEHLYESLK